MKISKIINHVVHENTYILSNDDAIIVIDPGSDSDTIITKIKELSKPVIAILLTHTHYDHIMGLDAVREAFDHPPVYVSDKEASWLYTPTDNLSGLERHSDLPDVIAKPAEEHFQYDVPYYLGNFTFSVVKTPGHSWGGVSFIFHDDDVVFTGDALFKGTIGRWDLPTSNHEDLIRGIKENLFTLPEHYVVHPGHGMNTTIGTEIRYNPHFN